MEYLFDVLILVVVFAVFGYIHSILASQKVKIFIKEKFGNLIAFYRFAYNLFSLAALFVIWDLAPQPSIEIYKLNPPFDYLVLIPQLIAIIGIIWCMRYISFKEFVGLNQLNLFLDKQYPENALDENYSLRIEGPYKYSRHPIYFFSIMFLLFRAEMNLFYLTMFISFTAYFYIGSIYEEKKMVRLFGDEYRNYQKKVPRIIPIPIKVKK